MYSLPVGMRPSGRSGTAPEGCPDAFATTSFPGGALRGQERATDMPDPTPALRQARPLHP